MTLSTAVKGGAIEVSQMLQLAEAVAPEDDWTGLRDAAARRKRQNRLNVRAHRRRKALQSQAQDSDSSTQSVINSHSDDQHLYWIEDQQAVVPLPPSQASSVRSSKAIFSYRTTPPYQKRQIVFPLSSDHLIVLIQFNALRALLTNFSILGLLDSIPSICAEAYDIMPIPAYTSPIPLSAVPSTLEPTALQLVMPHDTWIDIIPHPRWRDNMILAKGTYDEDDFCCDCVGGLWEGIPDNEQRGVMVWSDPWDVRGWEVSEGFFKKWGFFLAGCQDILASSNKHREARGEEPLVIEL